MIGKIRAIFIEMSIMEKMMLSKFHNHSMRLITFCVFFMFSACGSVYAVNPNAQETSQAGNWLKERFLSDKPAVPFSFTYGGVSSTELLPKWPLKRKTERVNSQCNRHILAFSDPETHLQLRCIVVEYLDCPAIEWTLYFLNGSAGETPILENVQSCDFLIDSKKPGDFLIYYAEGSDAKFTDFQPLEKKLSGNDNLTLASYGGRSSDGFLPFFNVACPDTGGLAVGIGWTGQWNASLGRTGDASLRILTGMEGTHLKLNAHEKIRTPGTLVVFWDGPDRLRGQNLLRHTLREHYSPTPDGKRIDPPIAFSVHGMYGFDGEMTEQNMVEVANMLGEKKLPVDYFWIDAGWYNSVPENKWVYTGTWTPDSVRFPNGLGPVGQAVHDQGFKFILWFEPERVMKNSWLQRNHPEWLLEPDGELPPKQQYQANDGFYLLNLGNPAVLNWVKNKFSNMIRDFHVDVYRQDFNIHPLHHWHSGDTPDRCGITEIKYITGLYEFWDYLIDKFPGLWIDNCASGGRRIDFESLRRSVPLWRSDECWKPIPEQCNNYGLSQWIPLHGMGAISVEPYAFWSGMGTSYSVALNLRNDAILEPASRLLNQYRSVKPLLESDFYPLTPYSLEENVWMAWQYDVPEKGQGLIQAFRRPASETVSMTFKLHGLEPQANYTLTNIDGTPAAKMAGQQLMDEGVAVTLDKKPDVAVIRYQKD